MAYSRASRIFRSPHFECDTADCCTICLQCGTSQGLQGHKEGSFLCRLGGTTPSRSVWVPCTRRHEQSPLRSCLSRYKTTGARRVPLTAVGNLQLSLPLRASLSTNTNTLSAPSFGCDVICTSGKNIAGMRLSEGRYSEYSPHT